MNQASSILIVDDEPQVLRSIRRAFAEEDYLLYDTTDPKVALELLRTHDFDVIISDNRMPELPGIDLLMEAKKISPLTVRILMSAYSDFDVVIAAINNGNIFHYIVKPWNNENMLEITRNAVQYKREQQEKEKIIHSLLEDKKKWSDLVKHLNQKIDAGKEKTVNALLRVIKVKDSEILTHCENVTQTALKIASAMGLSEKRKEYIRLAGLFHDIGKIAIRDNILYKKDKLDLNEFDAMKNHPKVGAEILKETEFMQHISDIVLQHHERVDGKGYPAGLAGEEILLEARIIAVADSFDALVADRVYRKGMPASEAVSVLVEEIGHYDKEVLEAFISRVAEK